jgi:hypothetical protein
MALALGGLFAFSGPVSADVIDDDTEVWVPAAPVEVEEVAVVECPECGRNNGAFSFNMGMDVATQYFFRGILQEDSGFIGQPYMNVGVSLYDDPEGALSSIALNGGLWNSLHSEETGDTGGGGPGAWYEADAYGGVNFGFLDQIEISTLYTAYMYPGGAADTVQEIALGLGWDDSDLLGAFALNPGVLFAWELDGTAFGTKRGAYVEFFMGPEFPITEGDWAFSVGVPMRLGLSMDDYYECTGAAGTLQGSGNCPTSQVNGSGGQGTNSNTFGFFDVGIRGDLALPFLHTDYGDWNLSSAVHFTSLGDSLQYQNSGDSWTFYGLFGLSMTY